MLIVGLTGGIGSGKSTVARLFAERGATVIDTDQLSRDLTQPGQPALQKIIEQFGPQILSSDGSLNRAALRKLIFNDKNKRLWLEDLLHPLIRAEMERLTQLALSPYCIIVIPLLIETQPNPLIDRILVVDTSEEQQIQRTQQRDNISSEEASAILNTQATRAQRLAMADDVIENNGPLEKTVSRVNELHEFYIAKGNARINKNP